MKKILGWANNARVSVAMVFVAIVMILFYDAGSLGLWGFLYVAVMSFCMFGGAIGLFMAWINEMDRLRKEWKSEEDSDKK